jgi:hypothetical protein
MALVLDAHANVYRDPEGTPYLRVTRILQDNGCIDTAHFTEADRERGRDVHEACRLFDDGELAWESLSPIVRPYVEAYRRWWALAKPEWFYVEHVVFDPIRGYAGTLDRAGLIGGKRFVVDLKSGEIPPTVGLQTAAYRRCLPDHFEWQRAVLQLKGDGSYRFVGLDDPRDEWVWLAAVTVSSWKQRNQQATLAA